MTHFCDLKRVKVFFGVDSFIISNIVLYLIKNKCLKLKLKNYPLNLCLIFLSQLLYLQHSYLIAEPGHERIQIQWFK